jgi:hypothetical protein
MKAHIKHIVVAMLALWCVNETQAQEIRAGIEVKQVLPGNFDTKYLVEFRNLNGGQQSSSALLQTKIRYAINNKLKTSFSARYVGQYKQDPEDIRREYRKDFRLSTDVSARLVKIENTQIKYRARIQADMEDGETEFMFRNKLKASYRISKKAESYFSLEPNYEILENEFEKIRVALGGEFKLFYNSVDVFLLLDYKFKTSGIVTSPHIGFRYIL